MSTRTQLHTDSTIPESHHIQSHVHTSKGGIKCPHHSYYYPTTHSTYYHLLPHYPFHTISLRTPHIRRPSTYNGHS